MSAEHLPICIPFTVLRSGHLYYVFNAWDVFLHHCHVSTGFNASVKEMCLLSLMDVTTLSSDEENSWHYKSDTSLNTLICYKKYKLSPWL